ncbi:uncharacterized protein LOC143562238 [Bidens hawaiensis]|uniref:uncharacterized protein LOC143562238 n=1 Tax=Bidens hawaiensis TaxID=980011 RepID=UPI00404A1ECB
MLTENDDDYNNEPLPAIVDLSITGDAFPGGKLQMCGYSINGAVSCIFKWVQHFKDGSYRYIEGTTGPTYTGPFDDVGTFIDIEVVATDKYGQQGNSFICFAHKGLLITSAPQFTQSPPTS